MSTFYQPLPGDAARAIGPFLAGEELPSGRLGHLRGDGSVILADSALGRRADGVILSGVDAGDSVILWRQTLVTGLSGRSPGGRQWLGTLGQLATSPPAAPNLVQRVGVAVAADAVELDLAEPVFRSS